MLKQRRSTRQPRTHAGSGRDREADAYSSSRERFPLYRYQSEPDNHDKAKGEVLVLDDDLEEKSRQQGGPRERRSGSKIERRISLQGQSYHGVLKPRIQSGTSNRNGEDDYYGIDHFWRPFNRADNPTRTSSPLRDYSSHSYVHPRAADTFQGRLNVGREKADLDYDVDRRNLGVSDLPYKPSRELSPYQGYTSYSRSYDDPMEATPSTNRPHIYQSTEAKFMRRGYGVQFDTDSDSERDRRRKADEAIRDAEKRAKSAGKEMKRADKRLRKEKERREGESTEELTQMRFENDEAKAAASNKAQEEAERLWRAENPEGPRSGLRARRSFSKLQNKDTISRDSTIGNEARIDDLLACVGKRMMKPPFLKEFRDESADDGRGSRIHLLRAKPPSLYPGLEEGYQSRSQLIEPYLTLPHGNNFQPGGSMPELGGVRR
ncbi:hypothetical protein IWW34DRAFT_842959 [Fusarium oxysporum f. sp. albedinis]|nr:hypothetical protein IWW34DRAFT_842959 [Fusarium oxysporum f. sp. albedinis]KAK2469189.1 hypothetical protein H9L39_19170 [Fusarium oxysporum f. sp. albedinis]